MLAELKIYKDCTSEEPTKVYTCRRLLLKTSKQIKSLVERLNKAKTEEEQELINIEVLKSIFPNFDEADFDFIDPENWLEFVKTINGETSAIEQKAVKNF